MAGVAMSAVQSQLDASNGWGQAALDAAKEALSALSQLELSTTYPTTYGTYSLPIFTASPPSPPGALVVGEPPGTIEIEIPEKPEKPEIGEVELGELRQVVIPDAPTIGWPDIETAVLGGMLPIAIPSTPEVTFPPISLTPPVYEISPPLPWAFKVGDVIITDDPMIQAVIKRLTKNITEGGTGLSEAVETAIWQRDLERNEQQLADTTDKVASMWAKKGFSLPDGMLAHSLSEVQKEYMNKMLDRTREIAIKQAELEQTNLFKSMELAVNLAEKLINMLMRYEELVFRGQEATAKYANEYIDLQIKTYMAMVDAYKATAQTYEMIIRGELAKVEVYKAQMEGQKLIGEINALTVQIYSEETKAISMFLDSYIKGEIARVDAFKAQIEGQKAIGEVNAQAVQVYSEQLKATAILMDRYKTEAGVMVALLDVEKAKIEANKLQFDVWAKNSDVQMTKYNAETEMFKAMAQINISTAEFQSKQAEAQARMYFNSMELTLKSMEVATRSNDQKSQITMEAARGVAGAAASMAAGAMAAMSAHASMSYAETQSVT
jgi:hypothetical protein